MLLDLIGAAKSSERMVCSLIAIIPWPAYLFEKLWCWWYLSKQKTSVFSDLIINKNNSSTIILTMMALISLIFTEERWKYRIFLRHLYIQQYKAKKWIAFPLLFRGVKFKQDMWQHHRSRTVLIAIRMSGKAEYSSAILNLILSVCRFL